MRLGELYDCVPAIPLLCALCSHLDCSPPLLNPKPLHLRCWSLLVSKLKSIADEVLRTHTASQEASYEFLEVLKSGSNSGSVEDEVVDAAAEAMRAAVQTATDALALWRDALVVLQQRSWWFQSHLMLPASGTVLIEMVENGESSMCIATLAAAGTAVLIAVEAAAKAEGRQLGPDVALDISAKKKLDTSLQWFFKHHTAKPLYKYAKELHETTCSSFHAAQR